MASSHELAALSYPTVERILGSSPRTVALIPVGSTEAHGPHLPLGTDSLIGEEVARRAAAELARRDIETVWFPCQHYAVTESARPFKGTTSVSREAAGRLLLETCVEAKRMGFSRVAIITAHLEGGHIENLRDVARDYESEVREPLVFPDTTRRRWVERLTQEYRSGSCHAGQYETSLILAIRPELVDDELARKLPERIVPLHEALRDGATFVDAGMTDAYCGNPAGASREEGEKTLVTLAEIVAEAVEESFA